MKNSRTYYYARVSSKGQNLARQLDAFKALGASDRDIVTDKQSGKDLDRPGYTALKTTMLRPGDTLVIKSLDRLSREMDDIRRELIYFQDNDIQVKIIDLPTTMVDFPEGCEVYQKMISNLMVDIIAAFAEQERKHSKVRQAEGIAAEPVNEKGKRYSSKTGKEHGRPCITAPANWNEVMTQWKAGEITAQKAMELTGMKRTSFYKLVKAG